MTAKSKLLRIDNVGIVVADLKAAVAFFVELGLELEGETKVEGQWVDRVVGLDGVRSDITLMRTPDGHSRLELTKFHRPPAISAEPTNTPGNTLCTGRIMFAVEDIDEVVARPQKQGAKLVGEVVQYEDMYRLCYLHGPEGIIVALGPATRKSDERTQPSVCSPHGAPRSADRCLHRPHNRKDIYERKKAALLAEQRGTEEQRAALKENPAAVEHRMKEFFELAKSAQSSYELKLPEEKRDFLKIVTSNRSVEGKNIVITLKTPFDEVANWSKNTNGCPLRDTLRTLDRLIQRLVEFFKGNPNAKLREDCDFMLPS